MFPGFHRLVNYGCSNCNINRFEKLLDYLPLNHPKPLLTPFDPQTAIIYKIASKVPDNVLKSDAPLYIPHQGLTNMAKSFIKTGAYRYKLEVDWPLHWDDCPVPAGVRCGKSIVDTVYLYSLCWAMKKILQGELIDTGEVAGEVNAEDDD